MTDIPWGQHNSLLAIKDDDRRHEINPCHICLGTGHVPTAPDVDVLEGGEYMVWIAGDPIPPWQRERVTS